MRTEGKVVPWESRLPRGSHTSSRDVPGLSRTRRILFGATLATYAAVIAAVLSTSWLVRLDWQVMLLRPYKQWPEFHAFLDYFVVLGQRGPTAVIVLAWLGWRCWKQRTARPLLILGIALLLLNLSVGSVKYGLGRLGPHYATSVGSAELFAGGAIFPSGHTANAVVTWGVLAYLATTTRARRVTSVVAAVFALGVGMTTIYLGTHWVSDVLAGWTAGLLVLLALPWFEPVVASVEVRVRALVARRRGAAVQVAVPVGRPPSPAPVPAGALAGVSAARGAVDGGPFGRRTAEGSRSGGPSAAAGHHAEPRLHHPAVRPHGARGERPPAGHHQPGSRRPYPERPAGRGAAFGQARERSAGAGG
ncbi:MULTISPECIES: phosphatase PAP2 family protein [unclassified Streptomyces]|uniref:phosphatase PAP2 family protein n=1 Tax=Streptomyces sp. SCUT-3 TaxID=2684469 RepID=UPI002174D960|nr:MULTISPECIES: phosphatase PAP2 family protein [unclassified Streptomyces]MCZ2527440.1 phosphatase PAP2 family protein [Streptomyces sp. HB2AG]